MKKILNLSFSIVILFAVVDENAQAQNLGKYTSRIGSSILPFKNWSDKEVLEFVRRPRIQQIENELAGIARQEQLSRRKPFGGYVPGLSQRKSGLEKELRRYINAEITRKKDIEHEKFDYKTGTATAQEWYDRALLWEVKRQNQQQEVQKEQQRNSTVPGFFPKEYKYKEYKVGDKLPRPKIDAKTIPYWGVILSYYQQAANKGHEGAKKRVEEISWEYHNDEVVRTRKGAESGVPESQLKLGKIYHQGDILYKDDAKAVHWYRKAADQNHAEAQYDLGTMYDNGLGVKNDYTQAAKWYLKAAEQGYADAQTSIGFMYVDGEGVEKDDNAGIKWIRKAAEQDDERALKWLVSNKISSLAVNFNFPATKAKSAKYKNSTLVFKGFYLGMPIVDAQKMMNHYLGMPQQSSKPYTPPKPEGRAAVGAFFGAIAGVKDSQLGKPYRIHKGEKKLELKTTRAAVPFATAGSDGKVDSFTVSKELRIKLFKSDATDKEFLKLFMSAYGMPKLESSRKEIRGIVNLSTLEERLLGTQDELSYRSPKGFEFRFFDKPLIFGDANQLTPLGNKYNGLPNSFSITKIQSAKVRKAAFD